MHVIPSNRKNKFSFKFQVLSLSKSSSFSELMETMACKLDISTVQIMYNKQGARVLDVDVLRYWNSY